MNRFIKKLFRIPALLIELKGKINDTALKLDNQLILNAKLLQNINQKRVEEIIDNIQLSEFKVYSQWGDDGIIQFLVDYLDIDQNTFIEFGVSNYKEANTRFLLINNNWSGLVMDGSKQNVAEIKKDQIFWQYDIKASQIFITKENINHILKDHGFVGEVGLLHIDIDGNDYWIWKEIDVISPVIVIMEYNSVFGNNNAWTVPYDKTFIRSQYHYSNLFFGSSLLSLCDLATEKGYSFIGCNSAGNNAYYVRNDKIKGLRPMKAVEGFVNSKFAESRDKNGNLSYVSGINRLEEIKGLEIYNTRKNLLEKI